MSYTNIKVYEQLSKQLNIPSILLKVELSLIAVLFVTFLIVSVLSVFHG